MSISSLLLCVERVGASKTGLKLHHYKIYIFILIENRKLTQMSMFTIYITYISKRMCRVGMVVQSYPTVYPTSLLMTTYTRADAGWTVALFPWMWSPSRWSELDSEAASVMFFLSASEDSPVSLQWWHFSDNTLM